MRNIEIVGYGTYIPENIVKFGNTKRIVILFDIILIKLASYK